MVNEGRSWVDVSVSRFELDQPSGVPEQHQQGIADHQLLSCAPRVPLDLLRVEVIKDGTPSPCTWVGTLVERLEQLLEQGSALLITSEVTYTDLIMQQLADAYAQRNLLHPSFDREGQSVEQSLTKEMTYNARL